MSKKKRQKNKSKGANSLRIIGGEWRSRKFPFIDASGLRPTPGRIRETVFNWLQGDIYNASCLDLFAGSGALGLEALSRGASNVVFVENNPVVATQLKSNLALLNSDSSVIQADALNIIAELAEQHTSFDIIFLDPPYRKGLLEKSLKELIKFRLVSLDTLIYLEHESEDSLYWGKYGLQILKQTKAGQVQSFLLKSL